MKYVTTGIWSIDLQERQIRLRRAIKRPSAYTEQDLMDNKYTIAEGYIGDCLIIENDVQDMWERLSRLAEYTSATLV